MIINQIIILIVKAHNYTQIHRFQFQVTNKQTCAVQLSTPLFHFSKLLEF